MSLLLALNTTPITTPPWWSDGRAEAPFINRRRSSDDVLVVGPSSRSFFVTPEVFASPRTKASSPSTWDVLPSVAVLAIPANIESPPGAWRSSRASAANDVVSGAGGAFGGWWYEEERWLGWRRRDLRGSLDVVVVPSSLLSCLEASAATAWRRRDVATSLLDVFAGSSSSTPTLVEGSSQAPIRRLDRRTEFVDVWAPPAVVVASTTNDAVRSWKSTRPSSIVDPVVAPIFIPLGDWTSVAVVWRAASKPPVAVDPVVAPIFIPLGDWTSVAGVWRAAPKPPVAADPITSPIFTPFGDWTSVAGVWRAASKRPVAVDPVVAPIFTPLGDWTSVAGVWRAAPKPPVAVDPVVAPIFIPLGDWTSLFPSWRMPTRDTSSQIVPFATSPGSSGWATSDVVTVRLSLERQSSFEAPTSSGALATVEWSPSSQAPRLWMRRPSFEMVDLVGRSTFVVSWDSIAPSSRSWLRRASIETFESISQPSPIVVSWDSILPNHQAWKRRTSFEMFDSGNHPGFVVSWDSPASIPRQWLHRPTFEPLDLVERYDPPSFEWIQIPTFGGSFAKTRVAENFEIWVPLQEPEPPAPNQPAKIGSGYEFLRWRDDPDAVRDAIEETIDAIDGELAEMAEEGRRTEQSKLVHAEVVYEPPEVDPQGGERLRHVHYNFASDVDPWVRRKVISILEVVEHGPMRHDVFGSEVWRTYDGGAVQTVRGTSIVKKGSNIWTLDVANEARVTMARRAIAGGFRLVSFDETSLMLIHDPPLATKTLVVGTGVGLLVGWIIWG